MPLKSYLADGRTEVGVDEAGRGCWSGPVVAAAVILPKDFHHKLLNDSKQVSEKNRSILRQIIEKESLAFGVAFVDHQVIDQINILNASFLAMHKAIDQIQIPFDFLLIDGNRFKPYPEHEHACIVKGDSKFKSIAAASILAKTYRDEYMLELAKTNPNYLWEQNKGYPTQAHVKQVMKHGLSAYHRKTYYIKAFQLGLDL